MPSFDPDANVLPSGEKATLNTPLVFPFRVRKVRPLVTSHRITVLSHDPDARVFPSGENVTVIILSECPDRVFRGCPLATSHKVIVLSVDPEANIFKVAHYGIVADWKTVLPAFSARLKEMAAP